jgi:two-component system, NtrC family, response regulator HydG
MNHASVLIVDDAADTREVLQRNLAARGYRVFTSPDVAGALRTLDEVPVDLVVTDLKMPRVGGLDLVRHVRENLPDVEVIMMTGYASIGGAVEAVQAGALDYLAKPFTDDELFAAVDRALDRQRARRTARPSIAAPAPAGLLGRSPAMQEIHRAIAKAAATRATVLITGESGTGKELVARAIHYASPRAAAAFVPINCGAIPDGLIESELFGHVRGAFTGADEARAGFFLTADGGSIFLDEIGELSQGLQVKLLRVLQDGAVTMVGSTRPRTVDVRILAATNKDLQALVRKGSFREDLYFRLDVITIDLPPLRDRGDDMLLLAGHFAEKFARELTRPAQRFSDAAIAVLRAYHWPGNVRELENLIQRLTIMVESDLIDVPDLPPPMRFNAAGGSTDFRPLAAVESEHIRRVLAAVEGNKTRAAEILGVDRKTLREKLKTLGEA